MSSLYDVLFDDIPLFVVPETEDSEVIEYETAMQRNVRFCNEAKAKQQMEEIERLRIKLTQVEIIGPWKQKRLPKAN